MALKRFTWLLILCSVLILNSAPGQAAKLDFPIVPIITLINSDSCTDKYVCRGSELCDEPSSIAIDNNCNGQVDEGCACLPGAQQACFKGDPSYQYYEGCYSGVQECSVAGTWGPCEGGVHATEACFDIAANACSAVSTRPFVPANLKSGTGNFSSDALSESWVVSCPDGVNPCPAVTGSNPRDDFTALASGEYSVSYQKTTSSGTDACSYPLFVGAPGLRVELGWEWPVGQTTVDLDLHLHKPGNTDPWQGNSGNAVDCAFSNCGAFDCVYGNCPDWFTGTKPPAPMAWYLDPVFENNSCYYSPRGAGAEWQANGLGCHNPRLDTDNINCDPTVTDPQNSSYCNVENINIDYPPLRQWTRIGVHYYSSHSQTYDVQPEVKVFCDGRLAARLGPGGFYSPQSSVTFEPADSGTLFWQVADVAFTSDSCGQRRCVVRPVYSNQGDRTPALSTVNEVQNGYFPAYPVLP